VYHRQQSHNRRQQERTVRTSQARDDSSLQINLKIHQNGLSIAAVLLFMVFACEACGSSFKYNSDRGLRQHQLNCEEFLQADNEASTVDDALEKY
jgi:hypothetical protein